LVETAAQPTQYPDDISRRWGSAKDQAIELLGELRADDQEAIDVLFRNLEYEVRVLYGEYRELFGLEYRYPAIRSLIRIGLPALDQAVKEVTQSQDPFRREKCTLILLGVLGRDQAKARITEKLQGQEYTGRVIAPGASVSRGYLESAHEQLEDSDWPRLIIDSPTSIPAEE
jgi:hypothetical protein